jgi:hypothetical protein
MAWALPPLPLDNWEDTKETLHRYCQIAGKVRMELSAFRNHWWHALRHHSRALHRPNPLWSIWQRDLRHIL